MKMKLYILSSLLLLSLFTGCSADSELVNIPADTSPKKTQVVLTLSVPAASLPIATRSGIITDDKEIRNITLWAFDAQDKFLYQIDERSTTEEGKSKIAIKNNKVYVLLPETTSNVRLALIANTTTITSPTVGTSKTIAQQSIPTYERKTLSSIPMYGESKPFIVKEGATPGTISLTRAMAKIEVDATNAWPLFELYSAEIVNVNSQGTVVSSSVINNLGDKETLEKELNSTEVVNNNKFEAYIPEATAVNSTDVKVRTFILLYGKNKKGECRYYRLDFIKRTQDAGGSVQYTSIENIERNHKYLFHIEHIVPTAGSATREEAIKKNLADNGIIETSVEVEIIDENIMDITTDNQYYLGVTSSQLKARLNNDGTYYITNMSVVANYENGWVIDDLPYGVEVSVQSIDKPVYDTSNKNIIIPTSVWIYIKKEVAEKDTDKEFTIYVYSRNIRKTITITIS